MFPDNWRRLSLTLATLVLCGCDTQFASGPGARGDPGGGGKAGEPARSFHLQVDYQAGHTSEEARCARILLDSLAG